MQRLSLLFIFLAIGTITLAQEAAPKKEKPTIYHPEADAKADIDAAVARAKKAGKHVFIQVGGNWCSWCIAFHNMIDTTPALKSYLNDHYETVLVNYSAENKNEAVLAGLGYPQRFGFPVFLILDGSGKLIHTQNSSYLETPERDSNGRKKLGHDPKVVAGFLKDWSAEALQPKNY